VNPVTDNGDVEVKVNQGVTSTQLSVKFCRFGALNQDCVLVGDFTTDANGNADVRMKFPKSGTWAGVFYLGNGDNFDAASQSRYQTEPAAFSGNFGTNTSYHVALQPENSVNMTGTIGVPTTPQPLTSGFVSETGQIVHAEV